MMKSKASYLVSFSLFLLTIDIQNRFNPPDSPEQSHHLDLDSVKQLPFFQPPSSESHRCLHPNCEFSPSSLIPNIQFHLRKWNTTSNFFVNRFFFCLLLFICSEFAANRERGLCLFNDKSVSS